MGKSLRPRLWIALSAFAALASCQSFPLFAPTTDPKVDREEGKPGKHSFRVSQFVFYHDFELSKNQPIFKELEAMREQLYKDLQLPASNSLIQVCLFEDRAKYESYMKAKYKDLPMRRAFFIAQQRRLGGADDLYVYTWWSDRVQQDLRHELTHAVLHASLNNVPLWLDEGLAEYYEMPAGWNGVNYAHLDELKKSSSKFDLERLESLTEVKQMTPNEYREAWAWTHLMLRTTPEAKKTLLTYLQELRNNPQPGPLKPRLEKAFPTLEPTVRRHLSDLELGRPKASVNASN